MLTKFCWFMAPVVVTFRFSSRGTILPRFALNGHPQPGTFQPLRKSKCLSVYDKAIADPESLPTFCRGLVGGPTQALLGDAFRFCTREIGLVQVKGKATLVPVFQVMGEATEDDPHSEGRPSVRVVTDS